MREVKDIVELLSSDSNIKLVTTSDTKGTLYRDGEELLCTDNLWFPEWEGNVMDLPWRYLCYRLRSHDAIYAEESGSLLIYIERPLRDVVLK